MTDTTQERLVEIETKVLHQESMLEDLSAVMYRQQLTIDSLEKKITLLEKQLRESTAINTDVGPHAEKPPHY